MPPEIGLRIRELREGRGMTLAEVSAKADLTISTLSQIERGIITPSISSLRRIAAAFSTPAFYFLIEKSPLDGFVVRREERRILQPPEHTITYRLLSPNLDKIVEMLSFELPPGEATSEAPMAHAGEECLVVLSGQMKVVLPNQEVILRQGDSIYFERCLPHQLINVGEGPASAICAISPPSF